MYMFPSNSIKVKCSARSSYKFFLKYREYIQDFSASSVWGYYKVNLLRDIKNLTAADTKAKQQKKLRYDWEMSISVYEAGWSLTDEVRSVVVEKCKNIEQSYELKNSEHLTTKKYKKMSKKIFLTPPPCFRVIVTWMNGDFASDHL